MEQVTVVEYASVNNPCHVPRLFVAAGRSQLPSSVANLAVSVTSQLLWPSATTNYGGQRLQRGYL